MNIEKQSSGIDPWFGVDRQKLSRAREKAVSALLSQRVRGGFWEGDLSSSALSTATAIVAIHLAAKNGLIDGGKAADYCLSGMNWLADHVNPDGGWGDTVRSLSNISTTTLCWAAFACSPESAAPHRQVILKAERWISERAGGLSPDCLARTIIRRYGQDRTFSVPILTMCALSGRLGSGKKAWKHVIPLPFELASLPHSWFAALRLPVVSYALPALIAIGLVRHVLAPSPWPWVRMIRNRVTTKVLDKLDSIQPENGGFLEATPLTGFVTMSLIGAGYGTHPCVARGLNFLEKSQRGDGSWPIDTNLATWVTTLSVNALLPENVSPARQRSGDPAQSATTCGGIDDNGKQELIDWLLAQQYREVHPYTQAAPGGWAWTPLPGGVPDADDTPGALIALRCLSGENTDARIISAASLGCQWLLDLQNRDGGIPTFCRGWGKLPFDKSSPDLTAHAIRAWVLWRHRLPDELRESITPALKKAIKFLSKTRNGDGSWTPLWFGNQWKECETNPVYGTSRVSCGIAALLLCRDLAMDTEAMLMSPHPAQTLASLQNPDGSWGNCSPVRGSIEETALAVEALSRMKYAAAHSSVKIDWKNSWDDALQSGARHLVESVHDGTWTEPHPIGFYFANLWYFEKLYPVSFTVAALQARDPGR